MIEAEVWTSDTTGIPNPIQFHSFGYDADPDDIVRSPTVTAGSDGSFTVGYEFFQSSVPDNDVRYVNVSSTGVASTERLVISGNDSASARVDSARLSNGDVVFVHDHHGGDTAIVYSVREPTGAIVTSARFVADTRNNTENDQSASVVALTGGGFVIAWENTDSDTDILMQR